MQASEFGEEIMAGLFAFTIPPWPVAGALVAAVVVVLGYASGIGAPRRPERERRRPSGCRGPMAPSDRNGSGPTGTDPDGSGRGTSDGSWTPPVGDMSAGGGARHPSA
ncbi:hypothetical protein SAMN05444521_7936 [Streptomyces sp. 3214.6]|nr:hypothetical protein SAMN05444521_7936 [Streptomyces sp. 3214.6]